MSDLRKEEASANIMDAETDRNKTVVKTGIIGIAANVVLALFKTAVGIAASSISIILDAVNNLSDAVSSVVTILGTYLANKPADRKHPLGYGRFEYLSAMIVSALVIYAGVTSAVESVKKIITPSEPDYAVTTLIVVGAAVIVKLLLGRYTRATGRKVNSQSLIASGSDALFDAVISLTTLAGATLNMLFGINIDGILGAVIALVIIKAGIEMLMETVDDILGKRADRDMIGNIKKEAMKHEGVFGVYDIFLDAYGPNKLAGSLHIEVDDRMTAGDIDRLTRKINSEIYQKYGVITTTGIYAVNNSDSSLVEKRNAIYKAVLDIPGIIQIHGFNINEEMKQITLDAVRDFDVSDIPALQSEVKSIVEKMYPGYKVNVIIDIDYSVSV